MQPHDFSAVFSRYETIYHVVIALAVLVTLGKMIVAVMTAYVAYTSGGKRAVFDYFFNPNVYRERQRERIRAGFRRNRSPNR